MWSKWIRQRGFKYPDEIIVKFIARTYTEYEKRNKLKVLIDGFASGRHVIYFAKEGFDTYGIDKEEVAVKNANEWLNLENLSATITQADALRLPFEQVFFDIVVDFGMIEHFKLENRKMAFEEINRVLKKGGVFIFVPKNNADHYYGQGEEIEKDTFILNTYFLKGMPTHFYSKDDLLNELKSYFKKVDLECQEHLRDNLTVRLSNWYAFCYK